MKSILLARAPTFMVMLGGLIAGTTHVAAETYRLVHAIGNSETYVARDLGQDECQTMKEQLIADGTIQIEGAEEVAELGTLTCLSEIYFE